MSKPFELGKTYKTKEGQDVTITEVQNDKPGYEVVYGDDGAWRYNRASDRGRVTGSAFDMSDPCNLLPEPDAELEYQSDAELGKV